MTEHQEGNGNGNQNKAYDVRILAAIRQIIRSVDIDSRKLTAEYQITGPQLLCLIAIVENKDGMTSRDLADAIYISPSTIVGILDRLEEKGYVERARSTTDRRVVHIMATPEGRKMVADVPYPLQDALAKALEKMPETQQRQLTEQLTRLVYLMGITEQ